MNQATFMPVEEHFDRLVSSLPSNLLAEYNDTHHVRTEECFRGRSFVLYEIVDREAVIIDNLTVQDFHCNEGAGASMEVIRKSDKAALIVDYKPTKLWDWPIFLFVPLHLRLRWSTTPSRPLGGSLAWPVCIRTTSRRSMRERGVIYCETGVNYAREFEGVKV